MLTKNTNAKVYLFKKGHLIYNNNDPVIGLSILFLKKGKVKINYKINNSKSLSILINKGNIFGLFEALSSNQIRITSATAVEDSVIWIWKKEDFLLNSNIIAELGLKAIFCLSKFLRTINQTIEKIG